MNKSDNEIKIAESNLEKENFYHKLRALEIIAPYIPDDDVASALAHLKKVSKDITEKYSLVRRKWWDFDYGDRHNMIDLNIRLEKLIKLFPHLNLDNSPDAWFSKPEYEKLEFYGPNSDIYAHSFLRQLILQNKVNEAQIDKMIANAAGAKLPDNQRKKSIRNTLITIGILSLVVIVSAVLIGLTYGGITPALGVILVYPFMFGTLSLLGIYIAIVEYPSNKNKGMAAELEEAKHQAAEANKNNKLAEANNHNKLNEEVTATIPVSTPERQQSQFPDILFKPPTEGASEVPAPVNTAQEGASSEDTTLKP